MRFSSWESVSHSGDFFSQCLFDTQETSELTRRNNKWWRVGRKQNHKTSRQIKSCVIQKLGVMMIYPSHLCIQGQKSFKLNRNTVTLHFITIVIKYINMKYVNKLLHIFCYKLFSFSLHHTNQLTTQALLFQLSTIYGLLTWSWFNTSTQTPKTTTTVKLHIYITNCQISIKVVWSSCLDVVPHIH